MTTQSTSHGPAKPVHIRLQDDVRQLIDKAAQSQGKTRTDFMVDAARRAAEDALLDQTFVTVDSESFAHFSEIFDRVPSGQGVDRLMNAKKPWG